MSPMFFIIVLTGFLVDIVAYRLCFFPALSLVRILYYTRIFTRSSLLDILFAGCAVLVESFLYNACCAIDLVVMVPLTVIAFSLRKIVHLHRMVFFFLSLSFLTLHYMVIDYGLFNRPLNCYFNWNVFFVEILTLIFVMRISFNSNSKFTL